MRVQVISTCRWRLYIGCGCLRRLLREFGKRFNQRFFAVLWDIASKKVDRHQISREIAGTSILRARWCRSGFSHQGPGAMGFSAQLALFRHTTISNKPEKPQSLQVAFPNDQDHVAFIGRYQSAWRRCMNHCHTAATGLTMTCQHDK